MRVLFASLACSAALAFAAAGCTPAERPTETPQEDEPPPPFVKATPTQPGKAPETKPEKAAGTNKGGRLIPAFEELVTPQGYTVKLNKDHDPWADRVISFTPGKPAPTRDTDPKETLGRPNYRNKFPRNSLSMGQGGELVLEFVDNVLIDGPGDDLVIFEVGPKVEGTKVAVSEDGKTWIEAGKVRGARSTVEIGPYVKPGQRFRFVKLTDVQKKGKQPKAGVPGADIDAVGALNSLPAVSP